MKDLCKYQMSPEQLQKMWEYLQSEGNPEVPQGLEDLENLDWLVASLLLEEVLQERKQSQLH